MTYQQGKRTVAVIGDPISAAGCHYDASIIMGIGEARVAKRVSLSLLLPFAVATRIL